MKQFILFMLCALTIEFAIAQQAFPVANIIAQKMQDSLSLDNPKKDQIYAINVQLDNQKMYARQTIITTDSLRLRIQGIENTRDSLYKAVLSNDKYLLYRAKKKNIINAN